MIMKDIGSLQRCSSDASQLLKGSKIYDIFVSLKKFTNNSLIDRSYWYHNSIASSINFTYFFVVS